MQKIHYSHRYSKVAALIAELATSLCSSLAVADLFDCSEAELTNAQELADDLCEDVFVTTDETGLLQDVYVLTDGRKTGIRLLTRFTIKEQEVSKDPFKIVYLDTYNQAIYITDQLVARDQASRYQLAKTHTIVTLL